MGSNWGCYPHSEVENKDRLSAYPLGYYLLLQLNLPTFFFRKLNVYSTQLRAFTSGFNFVDLISIASTKKKMVIKMNGKGDSSFKKYNIWGTFHSHFLLQRCLHYFPISDKHYSHGTPQFWKVLAIDGQISHAFPCLHFWHPILIPSLPIWNHPPWYAHQNPF